MTGRPVAVVLRALGLGDMITGLPALALLRRARPEHRIVLAMPQRWGDVVRRAGLADEIVDSHELAPLDAAPRRPDLAVDLHGNGAASLALLTPLAPRRVIAYAAGDAVWRHDEHEVARWRRLLGEALPASPDPACGPAEVGGLLGDPPPAPLARATVLHVGAASPSRRWQADRFAEVAVRLARRGHRVVISAGPGEEPLAGTVAAASGTRSLTGLGVDELFGLVGRARLLVSGDTGVAHVAAAYRTPTVTLFGPVSPLRWGPPPHPRHRVLYHGDDRGDPHGELPDPALLRISTGEVLDAVAALDTGRELSPAR